MDRLSELELPGAVIDVVGEAVLERYSDSASLTIVLDLLLEAGVSPRTALSVRQGILNVRSVGPCASA